jgi:LacI family sucrose operon transcriptional repressor
MGMKSAQYMLNLLQDEQIETNMDMPLFFVERESVRNLTKDYVKEGLAPLPHLA